MIKMVRNLQKITGGFGVLLGFVHDSANREATMRSWELLARYVVPELNGYTRNLKASAEYMAQHRSELVNGLVQSVTAAVGEDDIAKAAFAVTLEKAGFSMKPRLRRASHINETIGQGIVKLMPDGTIHMIDLDQDEDVVLRTIMLGR